MISSTTDWELKRLGRPPINPFWSPPSCVPLKQILDSHCRTKIQNTKWILDSHGRQYEKTTLIDQRRGGSHEEYRVGIWSLKGCWVEKVQKRNQRLIRNWRHLRNRLRKAFWFSDVCKKSMRWSCCIFAINHICNQSHSQNLLYLHFSPSTRKLTASAFYIWKIYFYFCILFVCICVGNFVYLYG